MLRLFQRDASTLREVAFVPDQKFGYFLTVCVLFDFADSKFNVFKRVFFRDVVDDDDALNTAVVTRSDRSESFLSSGVSDLNFHFFAFDVNSSYFKIHSNCAAIVLIELHFCKSRQQRRLPHRWVAQ